MTTLPAEAASAAQRRASGFRPIADYGLLADCNVVRPRRPRRLDRLAVPAALRLAPRSSRASSTPRPATGRSARRDRCTSERRYLPGTLVARDDVHDATPVRPACVDAMAFAAGPARARPRARRAARGPAPGRGRRGHGRVRARAGAAAGVRPGPPALPPRGGRRAHLRRPEPDRRPLRRSRSTIEDSTMRARFAVAAGERAGFALRWAAVTSAAPEAAPPEAVAARIDDTIEAWRSWEAEHDVYEGPHRDLVRLSARVLKGLTYRPTGAIVAAPTASLPETRRRRAQLGLPLLVDPRLEPDARGALHRRVPRRGRGLRLVHDELGRRPGRRGLAADHVRDRRRARPLRARARPPARLARLAAGARRQRRLGPDAARRLRRAAQRAAPLPRAPRRAAPGDPARSSPTSPTPPRAAGARPTRASGRCAASRATTCPPRCMCWVALDRAVKLAPAPRRARPRRGLDGRARRDPRRDPRARLERGAAGLRAVLRLRRARRARVLLMPIYGFLPASDARMRSHDRGDRPRADRGRPGAALPQPSDGAERRRPHRARRARS